MRILTAIFRKTITTAGVLFLIAGTVCADGLSLETGIYDNTHQFLIISDNLPASKVWKTFNTFWYDGPHDFDEKQASSSPVAQIQDGLYLDFCIRYGSGSGIQGVWIPAGNCRELSVNGGADVPARKTRLTGWYISDDGEVWKIPYWQVDAECNPEETARFTIGNGDDERTVTVQKRVQVGGMVYTCATGRSTLIRNPEQVDGSMLENAKLSSDGQVLSFSEPLYARRSESIEQLDDLITARNTTVYPPRFLWISPREPAIYAVVEQMPPHIDPDLDHPLN